MKKKKKKKVIELGNFVGLDRYGEMKVIIIHLIISDQEGLLSGPVTCISPLTADFSVMVKRWDPLIVSAS